MTGNDIFDELFVLEIANNHLGELQRGLKIISNYAQVVRFNNVRAAIKLQLRDVDNFIHRTFASATISATSRRRSIRASAGGLRHHGAGHSRRQLHPDGDAV